MPYKAIVSFLQINGRKLRLVDMTTKFGVLASGCGSGVEERVRTSAEFLGICCSIYSGDE